MQLGVAFFSAVAIGALTNRIPESFFLSSNAIFAFSTCAILISVFFVNESLAKIERNLGWKQ